MDNAFLGPLVSALGRGWLSRYNRGKKVNSNIQRMPLMIVMAWALWVFSVAAAIFFTGSTINGGGTNFGGAMAFAFAELVFYFKWFIILCIISKYVCGDYPFVCVTAGCFSIY